MRAIIMAVVVVFAACNAALSQDARMLLGEQASPPLGWVDLCREQPSECNEMPPQNKTVPSWSDVLFINRWVNAWVKPMSDIDHYRVLEKWAFPDDGYGDCEDYVLLKRRMLMQAGWPREKLLITTARDMKRWGHAILTVKAGNGDFILDNQSDDIRIWYDTPYHFSKRQSEADPNVWLRVRQPSDVISLFKIPKTP